MDRLIGIDYGRKRTGLAGSDPLGIFASALDTVDSAKLIDYIKNYAEKEKIVRFVVGYPTNLNGAPSEARADVDAFLVRLRAAFPDVPVTLEDERFTSVLAHRAMIDGVDGKMNSAIEPALEDAHLFEVYVCEALMECVRRGDYVDVADLKANIRPCRALDFTLAYLQEMGIR